MKSLNAPFIEPEKLVSELEGLLSQEGPLGFLFDECRGEGQSKIIKVDAEHDVDPAQHDIWFFGDIHGDLSGMLGAIKFAEKKSLEVEKEPLFVFLGDFTDRGPLDYLVLMKLYSMVLDEDLRKRMCIIAGNHDECLEYNEDKEKFFATVEPAEFTDWLNSKSEKGDVWHRFGKTTIEFFKRMPRAVFLPDGLFFAHAGVPHIDLHESLNSPEKLNEKQCLDDFVWARAHERAPKRRPNRLTRGHSFGRKDFYAFCEVARGILEQPVERMLRGHDHYLDGHRHYEKYEEKQMLTLNTRCIQPDTMGGPYAPCLCVARWVRDALPKVYQIEAPEEATKKVYTPPETPEAEKPTTEGALAVKTPAAEEPKNDS